MPDAATVIEALPRTQWVDLRLHRPTAETLRKLEAVIGGELPAQPGTLATPMVTVFWLAPHEWFIVGATPDRLAEIAEACAGTLFHVAEVTDGTCGYRLAGRDVADLIACGCSLDLHPTAFPVGHAARSLLDGVVVLLHRVGPDEFHLYGDSSFEAHLTEWFRTAEDMTLELPSDDNIRPPIVPMQTAGRGAA